MVYPIPGQKRLLHLWFIRNDNSRYWNQSIFLPKVCGSSSVIMCGIVASGAHRPSVRSYRRGNYLDDGDMEEHVGIPTAVSDWLV